MPFKSLWCFHMTCIFRVPVKATLWILSENLILLLSPKFNSLGQNKREYESICKWVGKKGASKWPPLSLILIFAIILYNFVQPLSSTSMMHIIIPLLSNSSFLLSPSSCLTMPMMWKIPRVNGWMGDHDVSVDCYRQDVEHCK